ncbi:hypothetical protein PVAND_016432 [Polypedilum vanderplanki]|uniref:Uncharacterized protein n=1 Tax=Polypedilum vanderplanki TaxID=319348 RepID=A0A9J6BFE9_POLVA|nr:hypothetical protein PVAND_016432 [Polypedilum vanderplanki]
MKYFVCFLIFIIKLSSIKSITIECDHETNNWIYHNQIYICNVISEPKIIHPNTKITQVIEQKHEINKTQADVNGLLISHKTVQYFPHGLENFFKNLTVIQIQSCDLKEIKKEDLRPLRKLKALYLPSNLIHLIEKDTFMYNLNLEVIWLNQNNIKYIDPNVFDHLNQLISLNLLGSVHDLGRASTQIEVQKVVTNVKEIFGFASVLWEDNQELTTEVAHYKTFFEISLVFNLLVLFGFVAYGSIKIAKKYRRSNKIHDESKISTLTELYEFQSRFRNANFNE